LDTKIGLQILSIQEIADRMIAISEHGFATCDDDGCLLLNGMVRECAYRLRDAAERERQAHGLNGNRRRGKAERTAVGESLDASVTALVRTALSAHRSTSSLRVEIETRNGEVTLTGTAGSAAAKSQVATLVADINGVNCVKNRMLVKTVRNSAHPSVQTTINRR
jgi:osmotically-inducible protein OsmY